MSKEGRDEGDNGVMTDATAEDGRRPALTIEEITEFWDEVFPQIRGSFRVEEIGARRALVRMPIGDQHLRPGGTVSGPSLMALADCGFYAAVLGAIGRETHTVTTNLSINFLRRPRPVDLLCEARILKLGRTLIIGDTLLFSDGLSDPVAHASVSYARPPGRS